MRRLYVESNGARDPRLRCHKTVQTQHAFPGLSRAKATLLTNRIGSPQPEISFQGRKAHAFLEGSWARYGTS